MCFLGDLVTPLVSSKQLLMKFAKRSECWGSEEILCSIDKKLERKK